MAKGINIDFVANVSKFIRGTDNVSDALDDVSDSLDDLGRDGDKAVRKLDDALDDAGREASRAADKIDDALDDVAKSADSNADKLERKFRDALDDVRTDAKKTGDTIDKETSAGTGLAAESVGEFKDEAVQNFAETASSFDGSMDSIWDMAQSTFGGLASIGGPVGMASGAIALLAGAAFGAWKAAADENASAAEERISQMYDDMLESGLTYLSDTAVMERVSELAKSTEDLEKAQRIAAVAGVDVSDVLRGWAGDADTAAAVTEKMNAATERSNFLYGQWSEALARGEAGQSGLTAAQMEQVTVSAEWGKITKDNTNELDQVRTALEAVKGAQQGSAEAQREAITAQAAYTDALTSTSEAIASNATEIADSTQRADANAAAIADLVDSGEAWVKALAASGASTKDVSAAQRKLYDDVLDAGVAMGMSADEARKFADQITDIPSDVQVAASVTGTDAATRDLDALTTRRVVPFEPGIDVDAMQRSLNDAASRLTLAVPGSFTFRAGKQVI